MTPYKVQELQSHLLDIMVEFDKVCKDHDLKYYLWYGTMLGAVRHKGFIPWDDDADLAMPREDYDKLVEHAEEWLPTPLELTCLEKNRNFTGTYAKLINYNTTLIEREHFKSLGGIYVDIFPLDGTSKNRLLRWWHHTRFSLLKKIAYHCNKNPYKHGRGIRSWLPLLIQALFKNESLQLSAIAINKKYKYNNSDFVSDFDEGTHSIVCRNFIGNPTPIEFEGHELMGVQFPDKYLTAMYGNYMQLPPIEQRRQHNFFYLDYNLPYREYKDTREFMNNK